MTRPRLLAAGAAHIDRRGRVSGSHVPGASNPGTMREEIGGGAFNALRNAVRHGVDGAILSLRGGDVSADAVAGAIAAARIEDLSAIYLDRTTPSYTAILDQQGELVTGFADMALYDFGFAKQVRRRKFRDAVERADALLVDANMPAAALARVCDAAGGRQVHAIAISPAKAVRLQAVLGHLSCLYMNAREARALAGLDSAAPVADVVGRLRDRGLKRGIVTQGDGALVGFDGEGVFELVPPQPRGVADVTGAGDAVAGVTMARLVQGIELRQAVRHGVAAAILTIETPAVVADYDEAGFAAALHLVGEARDVA